MWSLKLSFGLRFNFVGNMLTRKSANKFCGKGPSRRTTNVQLESSQACSYMITAALQCLHTVSCLWMDCTQFCLEWFAPLHALIRSERLFNDAELEPRNLIIRAKLFKHSAFFSALLGCCTVSCQIRPRIRLTLQNWWLCTCRISNLGLRCWCLEQRAAGCCTPNAKPHQ